MKQVELLSPAGDFECLKAAIQNGANAVYLGSSSFSARASATNFGDEELKKAIDYAHLRNVKINLTLNTLIKNNEFEEAFNIAKTAYEYGVDAIIVQDLGLAKKIIEAFPDLPVHASTQMTAHNLESVKKLEELGFKRVVLSRELSIEEIKYICNNTNVEIEVFIHGALCISYSGQCLFSSMIGGRSGNRGTCAQSCRLPYELLEESKTIDKGYLLSPRDLCSIENLKELIDSGITCFKIEGRMKKPEYVAVVTSIYRKYIDKINDTGSQIEFSENDYNDLMQVFNRGKFSKGHQESTPNTELIFKEKQNNMGIYIGKVFDYNENKGYVKLELENDLELGDSVSINNCTYYVSELMINDKNTKTATISDKITMGRMKGDNIRKNAKVYKLESKTLTEKALKSFTNVENIKTKLSAKITIHENEPITLEVKTIADNDSFFYNLETSATSETVPVAALNLPITEDRIISQLSKTGNTEFEFANIDIDLGDNLYIPNISSLNELRRRVITNLENMVIEKYSNTSDIIFENKYLDDEENESYTDNKKISLLLNILDLDTDYSSLTYVDRLYIPVKYFLDNNFKDIIKNLCEEHTVYIYLPLITKDTFFNTLKSKLSEIINIYNINGFVVSNLGQLKLVKEFNLPIVANYSFNIFNNYSENELSNLNFDTFTLSPELDKLSILSLLKNKTMNSEMIIYGKTPVMNSNYCLLGNSNKCYKTCDRKCMNSNKYYLKDRMGFNFRIIPDNIQTVTTIYNSKILSLVPTEFNSTYLRIDILDENISEINNIIDTVKSGNRLEGQSYTNGNLNRNI